MMLVAVLAVLSCRSGDSDAGTDAGPRAPVPSAVPVDASARPTRRARWDEGTLEERLRKLEVDDATYARRDVYSWTTHAQVEAIRKDRRLLVARANDGPRSPFVWLVESLARGTGDDAAVARLLASDTRLERRRYAWTAAYGTVLGLAEKRYGDELVHVRLAADAIVLRLDPARAPAFAARDLEGQAVSLAAVLEDPSRIAAVYHVRRGTDVPSPFREYVLVNEEKIAAYGVGTAHVLAEVAAEERLLHDLSQEAARAEGKPPRRARDRAKAFDAPTPAKTLVDLWDRTLSFPISRYELEPRRVHALLDALGALRHEPPLEYPAPGATDD